MNHVDFLLCVHFSKLQLEEQLEIKRLGPHRPEDFVLLQHGDMVTRTFKKDWFEKKKWLTASTTKSALFCFPCLLFGGLDSVWASIGFKDIKHLSERTAKHESSSSHLRCAMKLGLLGLPPVQKRIGDADRLATEEHNRLTGENRYVLDRLITCVKLCGKCEVDLHGHDGTLNATLFSCIFETMCEGDTRLKRHYNAQPFFHLSLSTIQDELLDCMYEVYREEVDKQLQQTQFVGLQVHEITHVSCNSQMAIVLRYVVNNTLIERFLELIEVTDKTAFGLSDAIQQVLEPLHLAEKLIVQTYDGAAMLSDGEGSVQTLMSLKYPNAVFVHCYSHQLNVTLQQACASRIRELKVFFADLSGFATFFTPPTRAAALMKVSYNDIQRPRWNFQSRTINAVWDSQDAILECLDCIRTQPGWDSVTVSEAYGLSMHLRDPRFLQLLHFFAEVMPEVDVLQNILQNREIDGSVVRCAVENFIANVKEVRERAHVIADHAGDGEPKRRKTNTAEVMKEACDNMIAQVEDRFSNSDYLIAAQLVDCSLFPKFAASFPVAQLSCAIKLWPSALKNKEKLQSELNILYQHNQLYAGKSALSLLQTISETGLQDILSETCILLNIFLATPMASPEPDRNHSAMERINTFARNT
uniref:TTF-type domain-containing protein n=1 Tax=Hippocampus comes TaxID=109280 RepID=A0A3Q2Z865_HIPCM